MNQVVSLFQRKKSRNENIDLFFFQTKKGNKISLNIYFRYKHKKERKGKEKKIA